MEMPEEVKASMMIARKGGRPLKLTPEVQKTIVDAVRSGNYMETAASLAGIDRETLLSWLKQGARAKSGRFKEFSNTVKRAVAEAEARDLAVIDKAADGWDKRTGRIHRKLNAETKAMEVVEEMVESTREFQWTAAAWRLERKFPNKWGRREYVELSTDPEAPLVIAAKNQDDMYSGKNLAAWMIALTEVNLAPIDLIKMIDVTPPIANGIDNNKGVDK